MPRVYGLVNAEVIVAFDDDFLMSHPLAPLYMRDFAARRREDNGTLNRLYAIESTLSVTGANADHRLAMPAHEVAVSAFQLAALLFERGLKAPQRPAMLDRFAKLPANPLLQKAADDLLKHAWPITVISAGPRQPPIVHALVHWLNYLLGNQGNAFASELTLP